jgi:hypothetical protein
MAFADLSLAALVGAATVRVATVGADSVWFA